MTHKEIKDKLIKTLLDINVQPFASVQDDLRPVNTLRRSWYVDKAQEIGIKNIEYIGINGNSEFLAITEKGNIISGCNIFINFPFATMFDNILFDDELNLPIEKINKFSDCLNDVIEDCWTIYPSEKYEEDALACIKAEDFFDKYLEKAAKLLGFKSFKYLTDKLNKGYDLDKINQLTSQFVTPDFEYDQVYEIREGLKSNVDISQYADKKFTSAQMAQLRKNLEARMDTSIYKDMKDNPNHNSEFEPGRKRTNKDLTMQKMMKSSSAKKVSSKKTIKNQVKSQIKR